LFFAAAGRYQTTLNGSGDYGYVWSSTPYDSGNAYQLYFGSGGGADINATYAKDRKFGQVVRPVQN
jgi:hypothetical protein